MAGLYVVFFCWVEVVKDLNEQICKTSEWDSNTQSPEYKSGVLPIHHRGSGVGTNEQQPKS
jgi:hypothetical protein